MLYLEALLTFLKAKLGTRLLSNICNSSYIELRVGCKKFTEDFTRKPFIADA